MYTDDSGLAQLLGHVLALYVALGMMAVGYGYMFAGKDGGARAAHWYFGGSLRWTLGHVWGVILTVLATLWAAVAASVRTIAHHVWRGLRWLFTHQRGPARQRDRKSLAFPARLRAGAGQLLAILKNFRARYLGLHSLPFVLVLALLALAIFVVCVVLLRRVLGW